MNNIRWFVSFCSDKNLQLIKNSSKTSDYSLKIISTINNKNLILLSNELSNGLDLYANSNIDVLFQGFIWDKDELTKLININNKCSISDAQLIFYLYRQYGENFIKSVKGIFFIFIWDRHNDLILGYRDRMGFFPFFYYQNDNNFTFSTTIKGLLLNSTVKNICNRAALADHLSHRWPKEEETFYEDIVRLRQGHKLRIKNNSYNLSKYWQLDQKWIEDNWINEDINERFETILEKSIRNSLEIGKNSIFLSGGLDSVSVGAYLTRICEKNYDYKPQALSLKFLDPECDEEEVQCSIAGSLSIPHYITPLNHAYGSDNLFEKSLEFNDKLSSPLLNFWLPGYYHLAKKAKSNGYDVVLTGGGGDEWLGVNPYYMADLIKSYNFRGIYRFLMNSHLSFKSTLFKTLYYSFFQFGLRPLISSKLNIFFPDYWKSNRKERYVNVYPDWIAPDKILKEELISRSSERFELEEQKRIDMGKYTYYFRGIEEQYSHTLTSWEMEENFEYSQSLNIVLFHPYWDSDMIEFLACIKPESLNSGGRSKGIVRTLMTDKFPNVDFKNQKKVYSVDYYYKILKDNYSDIDIKIKNYNSLSDLGIIDKKSVNRVIDKIYNGNKYSDAYRLWDISNTEKWLINKF